MHRPEYQQDTNNQRGDRQIPALRTKYVELAWLKAHDMFLLTETVEAVGLRIVWEASKHLNQAFNCVPFEKHLRGLLKS